jgi:23S rRNA (cytidine2498-2'-O)-methyltransferase
MSDGESPHHRVSRPVGWPAQVALWRAPGYAGLVSLEARFVFALCQRGAEAALKRELSRREPAWAAAYQRPGVVTFRAPGRVAPELELDSVLARCHGISLGTASELDELRAFAAAAGEPVRVHVIERDLFRPDEEPPGSERGVLTRELEQALSRHPELSLGPARAGELVLDVIVAPGEPWLVGAHRHTSERCPFAGGRYPIEVPPEAPSRAYAKIEEAIAAFELPIRAGEHALELGAAPGGAAYALARRGVHVTAVDPADMDAQVLAFVGPGGARIRHLRMPMGGLERSQLPERVDWLLCDVHLAPQVALRGVRRVASLVRGSLRGVVLTLKLNDWSFLERTDSFLAQARELGLVAPRARQLASHRQEIVIAGLTSRRR